MSKTVETSKGIKAKSFTDMAQAIGHTPTPTSGVGNEDGTPYQIEAMKHPQWTEILTYALARGNERGLQGGWMVDANAFIRYVTLNHLDEDFDELSRAYRNWKDEDEDGLSPACEQLPVVSHPKFAEIVAYATTKSEHGGPKFHNELRFAQYLVIKQIYSSAKLNALYRGWLRSDEHNRQQRIESDTLLVQLKTNNERCTTPASERITYAMHEEERKAAGKNQRTVLDYDPIPIPPVVSPITGNIVSECFRTIIHETKFHESDAAFYIGFHLKEPEGRSPAFYKVQDLLDYCEVMQRTKTAQPAHSYAFGLDRIEGAAVSSDGTVHGMYAVVGETGFQAGPCTNIQYANHIEKIYTPDMLPSIKKVLMQERDEKKRDLPRFIRRVSVKLWSDKTCELPT